jgi:hypothetical protein
MYPWTPRRDIEDKIDAFKSKSQTLADEFVVLFEKYQAMREEHRAIKDELFKLDDNVVDDYIDDLNNADRAHTAIINGLELQGWSSSSLEC